MAVATDREYADMVAGLAYIRRTGRCLARLPDRRLAVSDEDAGDVEYVNEVLFRILFTSKFTVLPSNSIKPRYQIN